MKTTIPNGLKTRPPSTERRGRARLESHSQEKPVPPKKKPNTSTYAGRIGARIRELREEREWSVEQLRDALARRHVGLAISTIYGIENGSREIDIDHMPGFAAVFGFKTVGEFLPPR